MAGIALDLPDTPQASLPSALFGGAAAQVELVVMIGDKCLHSLQRRRSRGVSGIFVPRANRQRDCDRAAPARYCGVAGNEAQDSTVRYGVIARGPVAKRVVRTTRRGVPEWGAKETNPA
jgi:hypothetical protein